MADWKKLLKSVLLADGGIDAAETKALKSAILADGTVDAGEIAFLTEVREGLKKPSPEFTKFYFAALEAHLLIDGKVDAKEARQIKKLLLADGKIDDDEKKFLKSLKKKAKATSPEFDKIYSEFVGK